MRQGLSQEDLAAEMGYSRVSINLWENEISHPARQATVGDLARVLQLSEGEKNELLSAWAQETGRSLQGPPDYVPPHFRLPSRVRPFVGRTHDLEAVLPLLKGRQSVILLSSGKRTRAATAITGMGGVGKTALAVELANTLEEERRTVNDLFPGGILFLQCGNQIGWPGLVWVYDRLLDSWNIKLSPQEAGRTPTARELAGLQADALRTQLPRTVEGGYYRALVVLDNVEADLPLQDLLNILGPLQITTLITSQAAHTAPSLRPWPLDVLRPQDAFQLFKALYCAAGGTWDGRNKEAVEYIVHAVGYLPLAIELEARQAVHPLSSIPTRAKELEQQGTSPALHERIERSFQKSFSLLSSTQQIRFAAFAVLDGADWPLSIVERLLDSIILHPDTANQAADDLAQLAALSLITLDIPAPLADAEGAASSPTSERVRLHPLLRELARKEWAAQPETIQISALEGVLAGVHAFVGAHQQDFVSLRREEDLIVGALRRTAQQCVASELVESIMTVFFNYLHMHGRWQVALVLLQLQEQAQRQRGDSKSAGATFHRLGILAADMGRLQEAEHYYQQALALRRAAGDLAGEGEILNDLALLAERLGNLETAERSYQQALALRQQAGSLAGVAETLNNLGMLEKLRGRLAESTHYLEQALIARRQAGDRPGEGATLNNLGLLARERGHLKEAQDYLEQALRIRREQGHRPGEAATLNNLGLIKELFGLHEEARSYFEQAVDLCHDMGYRRGEGASLNSLGRVAHKQGHHEQALDLCQQSLVIRRDVQDREGESVTLNDLGSIFASLGRFEEALQHHQEALKIAQEVNYGRGIEDAQDYLGQLALRQGHYEEAKHRFVQALALRREMGKQIDEAKTLDHLGQLATAQGHIEEARQYYQQALTLQEQIGDQAGARVTRASLDSLH